MLNLRKMSLLAMVLALMLVIGACGNNAPASSAPPQPEAAAVEEAEEIDVIDDEMFATASDFANSDDAAEMMEMIAPMMEAMGMAVTLSTVGDNIIVFTYVLGEELSAEFAEEDAEEAAAAIEEMLGMFEAMFDMMLDELKSVIAQDELRITLEFSLYDGTTIGSTTIG